MMPPPGHAALIMVRHTAVDEAFHGVCYGAADVALSPAGLAAAAALVQELADLRPDRVVHSGRQRARHLAEAVAAACGLGCSADPRIAELDFGAWERRRWDDIFAEVGHDIARMISEPDTYAPPGGETVHAVRARVVDWYRALPTDERTLAVSHGGPIGALRGTLSGVPAADWPGLVPPCGGIIHLSLAALPR